MRDISFTGTLEFFSTIIPELLDSANENVKVSALQFVGGCNPMEFVKDAQGRVTHFSATFVEGDLIGRRVSDAN